MDTELSLREAPSLLGRTAEDLVIGLAAWLNNKLMVISGNAELLESGSGLADVVALDHIRTAATQSAEAVDALVATFQVAPLSPGPASVNQALVEVTRRFSLGQDPAVTIDLSLAGNIPRVQIGARELVALITRVVQNAVDAVEPSGSVIRLSSAHDAIRGTAIVTVEDEGPGIAADLISLVTTPFFTTKAPAEHPGLGLSAVEGVVSQAGGSLEIDSAPERGTRVTVALPVEQVAKS